MRLSQTFRRSDLTHVVLQFTTNLLNRHSEQAALYNKCDFFCLALSLQPESTDGQNIHRAEAPDLDREEALHWTLANFKCSAGG